MKPTQTCFMRYFKRYIERELTHSHLRRIWNPLNGWKEVSKKEWYYGEHKPWTSEFKHENSSRLVKRIPVEPIKDWTIFKGDRVQIMVGEDKGKHGIVNGMVKERNWVYVEGLNRKFITNEISPGMPPMCHTVEKPLLVTTQVQLVDPADHLPTEIEWRYLEDGKKVRVSVRSGRVIPLPGGFYESEDLVNPETYAPSKKDTSETDLVEVTFKPNLCTFEDDIDNEMGYKATKRIHKTYWY